MKEELGDWLSWYATFSIQNPGSTIDPKYFFDTVQKTHANIRKRIGGIRKELPVSIADGLTSTRNSSVDPIITAINTGFGGNLLKMMKDYGIENPTLEMLKNDKVRVHSHRFVRTCKLLSQLSDQLTERQRREVELGITDLGMLHSSSRTKDENLIVILSTACKAFALLGHYGPDSDSCFRQGGGSGLDKYTLGQSHNSFVIIISDEEGNTLARSWGFMSTMKGNVIFNTCNLYVKKDVLEGNVIEAYSQMFANILGIPNEKLVLNENIALTGDVYQNDYGQFSFSTKATTSEQNLICDDVYYYEGEDECYLCGELITEYGAVADADGSLYCERCAGENLKTCGHSGDLTAESLVSVINENGKQIMIRDRYLKHYPMCKSCLNYFHEKLLVKTGKGTMCKKCSVAQAVELSLAI